MPFPELIEKLEPDFIIVNPILLTCDASHARLVTSWAPPVGNGSPSFLASHG